MPDASVLQAMGSPRRQEIVRLVWDRELTPSAIRAHMPDVTFGAISQHLRVLKRARLVTMRARGRERLYRADKSAVGPLRSWLEEMWDEALWQLKVQAEMQQAKRGPRPGERKAER